MADIWTETRRPADYACRGAYVAVSDGTLTHCTPRRSRSLAAIVQDYARSYSVNEPGEIVVSVTAYDRAGDETERGAFRVEFAPGMRRIWMED